MQTSPRRLLPLLLVVVLSLLPSSSPLPPQNPNPAVPSLSPHTRVFAKAPSSNSTSVTVLESRGAEEGPSTFLTASQEGINSPEDLQPPPGFEWDGNWKIDVSKSKYGWFGTAGGERRKWIRMVKPAEKVSGPTSKLPITKPSAEVAEPTVKDDKKQVSGLIQSILEDWNFKGYSLSIYKSFLYPLAFGLSLRLPLSQNFLSYFARPYLPSLTSSLGLYYPWSIGVFLSFSVPINLYLQYLKQFIFMIALRKRRERVVLNADVVKRVGFSVSYRFSTRYGFRFLVAPWVLYMPTLVHLLNILSQHLKRVSNESSQLIQRLYRIGERRMAGLGVTSSMYQDGISGSFVVSLNSFFLDFKKGKAGRRRREQERAELLRESGVVGE
ncbi:hypothetical protein TrST_g3124 [Triparma strigata]|uniref:Transmembrane protein n=1 Tax=Triparma strigata TaxID=1606541 RepID=A0A9W7C923_9STRA|nr:hypothetical protein TrST_g3124 [Triparma strigata]